MSMVVGGWVGGETGKLPPTWTLNVILHKIKVLLLKQPRGIKVGIVPKFLIELVYCTHVHVHTVDQCQASPIPKILLSDSKQGRNTD